MILSQSRVEIVLARKANQSAVRMR